MATRDKKPTRIFNDPIHGNIELNKACQLIVDTKEFQRLRDIKQLGFVDYVYPGATHTRFEHALGAYHLAGQYVRRLKAIWNKKYGKSPKEKKQKKKHNITKEDILCVEIAALCHDLGVGPFSTFFSKRFLPELDNDKQAKHRNKLMFEHMLNMNGLKKQLESKFKLKPKDIQFIKELIDGYDTTGSTAWPYEGRKKEKAFLYEIIQNHRNGIDVCKFDYMARDCQNLGISNNFDAERYMEFARIIEVDGELQICTRDKELGNLYNMFFTRYNLHKFAYQHPVVLGIEMMITELFKCVRHENIIEIESLGTEVQFLEEKLVDDKIYWLDELKEIYRQNVESSDVTKVYNKSYEDSDLKKMIEAQGHIHDIKLLEIKVDDIERLIKAVKGKKTDRFGIDVRNLARKILENKEEFTNAEGVKIKLFKRKDVYEFLKKNVDDGPFQVLVRTPDNSYFRKRDLIPALKKFIRMKPNTEKVQLTLSEIVQCNDDNAKTAFTHLTDGFFFAIRNFNFSKSNQSQLQARVSETTNQDSNIPGTTFDKASGEITNSQDPLNQGSETEARTLKVHDQNQLDTLLERLYTRDVFKFIGESPPISKKDLMDFFKINPKEMVKTKTAEKQIRRELLNDVQEVLNKDDIKVKITYLDFGMKDENPIHRLRVYSKNDTSQAKKMELDETSNLLKGMNYNELIIRVYATFSTKNHQNSEKLMVINEVLQHLKDEIKQQKKNKAR